MIVEDQKEEYPMIEVHKTSDLLPGIYHQTYFEYSKQAISTILQASGVVEIRSNRGLVDSPQLGLIKVWQSLPDWAKFAESSERQKLESELLKFAMNIVINIMGPSPVLPEPLRPEK